MDAFKASEIERMRLGGNERWRKFFEEHEDTQMRGITWDDATIAERYSGEVGEEWKERLSCKVEDREYIPGEKKPAAPVAKPTPPPALSGLRAGSRTGTPLSNSTSRSESPGKGGAGGRVKVDDRYFSKLGAENASRPDHVPPNQGGKYAGFGNTPAPGNSNQAGIPNFDDLQKDPMAALTKGFGWFTSTVSKTAKTVNDGYIQPTAKQVCGSSVVCFCCYGLGSRRLIFRVDCRGRFCQTSPAHSLPVRETGTIGGQISPGWIHSVRGGQRRWPQERCTAGREPQRFLGRLFEPGGTEEAGK